MKTKMPYRQGDVGLRAIKALPDGAEPVDNAGRIVLAHGEVTGHAHAVDATKAREFTMRDAGNSVRRFLEVVSGGAEVKHEEHAAIPIPPGIYEIVQQSEYDPMEVRQVAD